MTRQRKDEIERKVFYRHIESIMRTLEQCKDTYLVFQIGMDMGYLHRSLSEELDKEVEPQESDINSVSDNQYAIGHQNGYNDGLCDAIKAIKNIAESE